ncbi:hypothetical protein GE061_019533 [Apolygus lucorum]|uniref:Uncharacterized protein n=1 Tax=Apolygus lucorum TaxID=248454 RepID=A0A6A4JJ18_APOLU|nr:hypothetical protein GE061_019533 [Apolygus lucorum]
MKVQGSPRHNLPPTQNPIRFLNTILLFADCFSLNTQLGVSLKLGKTWCLSFRPEFDASSCPPRLKSHVTN